MLRTTSLFFLLLSFSARTIAQDLDGIPTSLKYKQIDTDTIRVIYPEGLYEKAERVANTIHYMEQHNRRSVGNEFKKLNIVLQNQNITSNGFVALAPFRSNFFTTPEQQSNELGSISWLDLLSLHEYRHAMQFTNTLHGLTKFMYLLGGQAAWAGAANLAIPDWFWEGDAVVNETALSLQGRGRIPYFFRGYKALEVSQKRYSYTKVRNGSFKDIVPDHYKTGYLMCTYARNTYGNDFWEKIIRESSAYNGLFYPFNKSLKRNTGFKSKALFEKTLDYYRFQWSDGNDRFVANDSTISKLTKKRTPIFYTYAYFWGDRFICNKSAYNEIAAITILNKNGSEKRLALPGLRHDDHFSFNGKSLCWTEYRYDNRWNLRNYSVIMKYDIATGEKQQLTHNSKFFAPDIDPENKRIAVVEVVENGNCFIHIVNASNGKLITKLPNPEQYYFTYPKWSVDGKYIYTSCRNSLGEMGILKINPETGEKDTVLNFINHIIGNVFTAKKHLYFQASFNGTDNIYALDIDKRTLFRLTSSPIGAYNPAVSANEDSLIYNEYTYKGNVLKLLILNFDSLKPTPTPEALHQMSNFQTTTIAEEGGPILKNIPKRSYIEKSYPKSKSLINIHGWSFIFLDPSIGVSITSTNILNTFSTNAYGKKNLNEKATIYGLNMAYSGWYPVLKITGEYANNRYNNQYEYRWNEFSGKADATIPFNFSRNLYSRFVTVSSGVSSTLVNYDDSPTTLSLKDFNLFSYEGALQIKNIRKYAYQNLYSHFAQVLELKYKKSISGYSGEQLYSNFNNSFRGVGKNHNLLLQFSSMYQLASNDYGYINEFFYPRGYSKFSTDFIYRVSGNYHFPLLYPDKGINGLLYIKRIRANLFYDYAVAERNYRTSQFNSYGAECILDLSLFNTLPYELGLRYSILLNNDPDAARGKSYFELFFPIQLFK